MLIYESSGKWGPRRTAILLILINKTSKRCHICVYLLFGRCYGVIKVKKNKNGYTSKWVFFFPWNFKNRQNSFPREPHFPLLICAIGFNYLFLKEQPQDK